MDSTRKIYVIESVSVLLAALILVGVVLHFKTGAVARYSGVLAAAIWLYLPVAVIIARKINFADIALHKLSPAKSLLWFAAAVIIIFPIFYFGAYLGAGKILHFGFQFEPPKYFWNMAVGQLMLISFPEEWFFRGYLQGRLNQALGRDWRLFGARIGPSLFIVAAVFALAHFAVRMAPDRLLVFFPALVFGWLREKTDSIIAPILFHFAANLTFIIFQMSLIR